MIIQQPHSALVSPLINLDFFAVESLNQTSPGELESLQVVSEIEHPDDGGGVGREHPSHVFPQETGADM